MSGGGDLGAPGLMTLATSSRWMPDGTAMPAGTSALISVYEIHVVGSVVIIACDVLSESSSWAPGRKSLPKICTPKLVALFSTLGPIACTVATVPGDGMHWQSGRHCPGHALSS